MTPTSTAHPWAVNTEWVEDAIAAGHDPDDVRARFELSEAIAANAETIGAAFDTQSEALSYRLNYSAELYPELLRPDDETARIEDLLRERAALIKRAAELG